MNIQFDSEVFIFWQRLMIALITARKTSFKIFTIHPYHIFLFFGLFYLGHGCIISFCACFLSSSANISISATGRRGKCAGTAHRLKRLPTYDVPWKVFKVIY
ncbi:hypothetical protein T05_3951 [Trichinella murrelli]|uniref:Uncharacterized protein n=1 Tax=Trichinella murrelli TaxID=144512 RepID=A0A0V0U7J1_9BILA|nr:hypothetical protein T05_3951 [Trichinella murrelli]